MVLGGLFFFNDTATTEIYTLSLHDALPICERHGLGDAPVVVCVSRLVARKGQDVLVAGWPRVLARHPDARLLLVGGGPMEASLRRGVAPLGLNGSVCFTGPLEPRGLSGRFPPGGAFALACHTRGA